MSTFKKRREFFKDLLDNNELVNGMVLTEDGGEFKVHLELIAALSPRFKKLIPHNKSPVKKILVPGFSKEIVSNILHFIYTGELQVVLSEVENLILAADKLEIPVISNICIQYLIQKLDEENCIKIYNFAKSHKYENLKEEAKKFLSSNFTKIFPVNDDFLELEIDDVINILESDELNVKDEENAFWAVMRWVENNPEQRRIYLPNLLRCVRLCLCNFQFYQTNICTHPYVIDNDECQIILYQASVLYADMNNADLAAVSVLDMHHPFVRPRVPHEIIFIVGGWSAGSATNIMETYDLNSNRWYISSWPDSMPRAYHGMVYVNEHVYIIGGFDGNQCFNCVRCYDPVLHTWQERSCMFIARCYVSVATLDGSIYAMGGYDGHRRSNTAERYDLQANQWYMIASMMQVRSDASADSLNGKVYIAGGFNGAQVLNSVEVYNPEVNEWTMVNEMSSPRSGVKLVAYDNALYIIGGFNGTNRLASEKYDKEERTWSAVPSMRSPRSNFATAVIQGCLFVIGGFNGLSTVQSVECFDSKKNIWLPIADLNLNRSALSACSVIGLQNGYEYSYLGNGQV